MKELWQRIEDWLSKHYPAMVADLNPGCSLNEVLTLEGEIGVELPESFKAFYAIHNGQRAKDYIGLFYNISLLPLADIPTQWNVWSDIMEDYGPEGMEENFDQCQTSLMPDKVKAMYANRKWIPFAVIWDSNYLGLDFDPGPEGRLGQVINFGREEEQKAVLANSFEEFIEDFIEELESGGAVIREDGDQFVFVPKRFEWRFKGEGTRLGGYVACRFIEEPTVEEQEALGILL